MTRWYKRRQGIHTLLLLLAFISLLVNPTAATNQSIGNWTLNEGAGTWANDTSGNNYNGTISDTTWTTYGVNGSALDFNGSDFVNISTFLYNGTFTYSVWFKLSSINEINPIFSRSNGYQVLYVDTDNKLKFLFRGLSCCWYSIESTSSLVQDHWYNAVISDEDGSGFLRLYLDNESMSYAQAAGLDDVPSGILIGKGVNNFYFSNESFNGIIDELKAYNYVLNTSERTALYNQYQFFQIYPTDGITILGDYPPITTDVNFTWHDTQYSSDELVVSRDADFNLIVLDIYTSNDYYSASLEVGQTYYWKVVQNDALGATSATESFTISNTQTTSGTAIQGTVSEILNGVTSPLSGVTVYISNSSATWSSSMVTGTNGYYLFDGLSNTTTYYIYASKSGYTTSTSEYITTGAGTWTTKNIQLITETNPVITDIIYGTFNVRSLFDIAYPGVTITLYKDSDVVAYKSGVTDSKGQATFEMRKGQYYRVTISGGGLDDMTEYVWGGDDEYRVTIFSGFPTGGDQNSDISVNLTTTVFNATYNNLSLIYNDTTGTTSSINFYANRTTNGTMCAQNSTASVVTLNCTVLATGIYTFGYNATTSIYGFQQQDKVINFGAGNMVVPTVDIEVDSTLLQWGSIAILIFVAALFSGKYVKYGAVVVPLFAFGLWWLGWFAINVLFPSVALVIGIMVYMRMSANKVSY